MGCLLFKRQLFDFFQCCFDCAITAEHPHPPALEGGVFAI
nr:MAG TPA: hypothetical protein [Caudoviricetes sp.]